MVGRREHATEELEEAWRIRNLKEAHRLIRLLAARGRGPRGRSSRHLQGAALTSEEWMSVWGLEGPQGGMEAVEVTTEEDEETEEVKQGSHSIFSVEALTDMLSIAKYLRRAPKR
eukprot:7394599-Pyramimonas_sp.AAC.1